MSLDEQCSSLNIYESYTQYIKLYSMNHVPYDSYSTVYDSSIVVPEFATYKLARSSTYLQI